jgi:rod shape-determining protein MreD
MTLWIAFALALAAWILQGAVFPQLAFFPFVPFAALAVMTRPLSSALWLSAFAGLLVDLGSSDPIGVHAINHTLSAALFWRIRRHFSADRALHLSLFTGLMSFVSTFSLAALLFLFDRRVPFHGKWVLLDCLCMPVIDALYALVWFSSPLLAYAFLRRHWTVFWLKKKNPSPT